MKELIGKTIKLIHLDGAKQHYLKFTTNNNEDIIYYAEGDCCSESWFADICGVDSLIGHEILSVTENALKDYDVNDGRCREDEDEAYGYDIKTPAGVCCIVFRNSSNGYYGGMLTLITDQYLSNSYRQWVLSKIQWQEIKEDYSA